MAVLPSESDTYLEDVECLDHILLRLSWISRKQLALELEVFQLTVPQFAALRAIQSMQGACTMRDLAKAVQQLSPTMTGIIDRLVERDLVSRQPDPRDRRALRVALTQKGLSLLDEIACQRKARLSRTASSFEPEERSEFIRLVQRYLDAAQSSADASAPG